MLPMAEITNHCNYCKPCRMMLLGNHPNNSVCVLKTKHNMNIFCFVI